MQDGMRGTMKKGTPEYRAKAEQAYQEGKRRHMEFRRRKGIPHELEGEPEELEQSEISRFASKTAERLKNILKVLSGRRNTKERSPLKATSSGRQPEPQENVENSSAESDDSGITGTNLFRERIH